MQLTSFTDYGLRALIYMASLPQDKMTSISEVTEVYGVSRNHMVKIINQLSRVGFVTATWCGRWSRLRWLTAAASFATSPLPAD